MMALCAGFMFFDLRPAPIVLWDESRLAVNALEMHLSGHLSLITTYGFQPDLWNTKPPLLIWLMDLSMAVFGPSEWSLRAPSMIASLGTLALVMSFTRRVTHSFKAGALAALLLALSIGFFGEHGARTADYDALLCFLTTAYLYVLFFSLHRRRPGAGTLILAGGLVGLAVLTKSIAGLAPGAGVVAYLLLVGRWRRPLQNPWYALAAAVALALAAAFFLLREHAHPGYLKAAFFNDVSGRFTAVLDRHSGPPWYYFDTLFYLGAFSARLSAFLAPLALLRARGPARLGLWYSLCIVGAMLAVLSASATKLLHYALPVFPFLAIFSAIAVREGFAALGRAHGEGKYRLITPATAKALLVGLLGLTAAKSTYFRTDFLPGHEFYPQARYGELFRSLSAQGLTALQVVDGGVVRAGVVAAGVPQDYAPQLDFYTLLADANGSKVRRISPAQVAETPVGGLLASCDPGYTPRLRSIGPDLAGVDGCVAVRQPAPKT